MFILNKLYGFSFLREINIHIIVVFPFPFEWSSYPMTGEVISSQELNN